MGNGPEAGFGLHLLATISARALEEEHLQGSRRIQPHTVPVAMPANVAPSLSLALEGQDMTGLFIGFAAWLLAFATAAFAVEGDAAILESVSEFELLSVSSGASKPAAFFQV